MSWQHCLLAAGLSISAILFGCDRDSTSKLAKQPPAPALASSLRGDAHDHQPLLRRLTLSAEVVAGAGIKVTRITRQVLHEALELPGEIAADPDRLAQISSPAPGRIEQVSLREGELVKKGDPLLVIRVPEIARVRSSQVATRARAKAARASAARLRALFAEHLTSEQTVLDAEAEAEALEVEAASLGDELGALGAKASGAFSITLRAPISGTVVSRNAVVGQPTPAELSLGTVADLDEVWFLARVFEKDLGRLRVGASAEVHLNAYPSEHFAGSVEYVAEQIDPVARTVTARIRLRNRGGLLRLGLFGASQVSTGNDEKAEPKLVVAEAAVTDIAGKAVVFVRRAEHDFEPHEVTLGHEALGKVEVLAGLREGEEVVEEGVFTLKSLLLRGSFGEDPP